MLYAVQNDCRTGFTVEHDRALAEFGDRLPSDRARPSLPQPPVPVVQGFTSVGARSYRSSGAAMR